MKIATYKRSTSSRLPTGTGFAAAPSIRVSSSANLGNAILKLGSQFLDIANEAKKYSEAGAAVELLSAQMDKQDFTTGWDRDILDLEKSMLDSGGDFLQGSKDFQSKYGLSFSSPQAMELAIRHMQKRLQQKVTDPHGYLLDKPGVSEALADLDPKDELYHDTFEQFAALYNTPVQSAGFDKVQVSEFVSQWNATGNDDKHIFLTQLEQEYGTDLSQRIIDIMHQTGSAKDLSILDAYAMTFVDPSSGDIQSEKVRIWYESTSRYGNKDNFAAAKVEYESDAKNLQEDTNKILYDSNFLISMFGTDDPDEGHWDKKVKHLLLLYKDSPNPREIVKNYLTENKDLINNTTGKLLLDEVHLNSRKGVDLQAIKDFVQNFDHWDPSGHNFKYNLREYLIQQGNYQVRGGDDQLDADQFRDTVRLVNSRNMRDGIALEERTSDGIYKPKLGKNGEQLYIPFEVFTREFNVNTIGFHPKTGY